MWAAIWKLDIPHKMRHFWWRACSNSLATKENLVRRKCGVSKGCPICGVVDESIEHVIFDCEWVRAVWFGCNVYLNLNQENSSSIQKWTSQVGENLKGEQLSQFLGKAVTVAWFIWKTRNEFIFNSDPIFPEKTVRRAFQALREFSKTRIPPSIHVDNLSCEDNLSHWKAPDQGNFKFNCDVAVSSQGREAVAASVLRNWKGELVDGRVARAKISSPLQGELIAIRLACVMARALGISNACIESDNQQAIKLSVFELDLPWEVLALVSDIRQLGEVLGLKFS
ncbi:hypothetical protein RHMOL_Rhmol04G0257600 [Rhododendron molle]|uniref:Uncharacterized protein n=1 Tax=Rhododendron molle TaxID=49168 RepID=A0ACC0P483_RHOML|nr:hypothetical protein RHMOL_Rhmol04G0257600 [Rhododendron molle]